jgi:hypothetical protein
MSGWLQLKSNTNLRDILKLVINNKMNHFQLRQQKASQILLREFSQKGKLVNSPLKSSFCEIYRLALL